ncbi:MAG: extracellular solute-binding protein [Clostridia bacterium]|nr:extracellular solute-binding protein [Clostridia bacterium]
MGFGKRYRLTAGILSMILMLSCLPVSAATLAEKLRPDAEYGVSFDYTTAKKYADVKEEYDNNGYQPVENVSVTVPGGDCKGTPKTVSDGDYQNALVWKEDTERVVWSVQAPVSGLYSLTVCWKTVDTGTENILRDLKIDGEIPFSECEGLTFSRLWVDELNGEKEIFVRPKMRQLDDWQKNLIYDRDRMYDEPLLFYLEKGEHRLEMIRISGNMMIGALIFGGVSQVSSYEEVSSSYADYPAGTDRLLFEAEGEQILYKNSNIIRMSNTGDPSVTPRMTGMPIMNMIGGSSWQGGGTAITYQIEVKSDGLYQIAFHLKQSFRDGLPSYRRVEIDGELPFAEMSAYSFINNRSWRTEVLSDEKGEPYRFYLTAGKHTLTLTVAQGPFREVLTRLEEPANRLSKLSREIRMLVGSNPDIHYDYELETKIPGLEQELSDITDIIGEMMTELERISGNKVAMYYQLESMQTQLRDMINDPFIIPAHLADIDEMLTTIGNWQNSFAQHPLELDTVEIFPAGEKETVVKANIFQRLWVGIVSFVYSFTQDYDSVASTLDPNVEVNDTLEVWIGRGTDWAELIKQMADEEFTPETGVAVDINILPASQLVAGSVNALLLAIAAGKSPDVCLSTTLSSVGEFALRNALVDLTQFEDFPDVRERFVQSLFIPMQVGDGIYGLPETMNIAVMAYRKDILSELGLGLPNTWDELYQHVIPVLAQNNMQFFFTAHYDTFLFQLGGQYFTDDLKYSALNTPQAYQAFKELCDLFTLYGVPVSANFYNRFRTGEMPIGIIDYTLYMTVRAAAVELQGRWGIAPIPGHMQADGTINRSHSGLAGECTVIMSQTKKQDIAWEFLKWWSDTDTQSRYGYEIEAFKGEASRWNTANLEAFSRMSWNLEDLKVIESSWEWNCATPVVLGGYFNTRHVSNAINRVVVSGMNARDSLEKTVRDINAELRRRRGEER